MVKGYEVDWDFGPFAINPEPEPSPVLVWVFPKGQTPYTKLLHPKLLDERAGEAVVDGHVVKYQRFKP